MSAEQYTYNDQPQWSLGQVASAPHVAEIDSYLNPLLAQESTVTVGGATDGVYTVRIQGDQGSYDFSFTASSNTAAQIVTGLKAAAEADIELASLAAFNDNSAVLEIDFTAPGFVYAVSFPSNPGTHMVHAIVTAAGGVDIGLALGVVWGSAEGQVAAPVTGSTDASFAGASTKNTTNQQIRAAEGCAPGEMVSVLSGGDLVVRAEDAVTQGSPVFMRKQNPGADQSVGGFRSDADGADAIQITGLIWLTSTTGTNELAVVRLNRP